MRDHELARNPLARGQVLMVATSCDSLGGEPSGAWLSELAIPYVIWKENGFDVTIASIKGGKVPLDPKSLEPAAKGEEEEVHLFTQDETASQMMTNSVPLDKVASMEHYNAIFLAGGHGASSDFPDNPKLGELLKEAMSSHKVVAALCHGTSGLTNLSKEDLTGLKATAYSHKEEEGSGKSKLLPFMVEDKLREMGVEVTVGEAGGEHTVRDRYIITGQNHASAYKLASLVVEAVCAEWPAGPTSGHTTDLPASPRHPGTFSAAEARAAVGVDLVGGEGAPHTAMSMDVSAAQGEEGEGAGGDVAMGDIEGELGDPGQPPFTSNLGPGTHPAPGTHTGGTAQA